MEPSATYTSSPLLLVTVDMWPWSRVVLLDSSYDASKTQAFLWYLSPDSHETCASVLTCVHLLHLYCSCVASAHGAGHYSDLPGCLGSSSAAR